MTVPQTPQQERRAILVIDLAESVRLMSAAEQLVIAHWRLFVQRARAQVLPATHGRLVKSLGDGLLLDFGNPLDAVRCSWQLHDLMAEVCAEGAPGEPLRLRAGVHVANVVVDELDIYGSGVNLAARVAGLAQPDQTVVTAAVRDELLSGLEAEFDDLGDCFLKNVDAAVRAFRVSRPHGRAARAPLAAGNATRPTLLVAPLRVAGSGPAASTLGDVVTADLIQQFSRCGLWHVISRLSAEALKGRAEEPTLQATLTGADYVVSGQCRPHGSGLRLGLQLTRAGQADVIWACELDASTERVLKGNVEGLEEAVREVSRAIVGVELLRAEHLALPTLEAYSILFRAVTMLHRTSVDSVAEAQQGLEYLTERHPREAEAHAWAARAQVLRVAQGSQRSPAEHAARARDHIRRALDVQPAHGLAQAIEGLVRLFIERDLDGAARAYQAALVSNPNEALAWLFLASVHAHREQGQDALACVAQASKLSPLDPMDHYYNGVTAWALLAAGDAAGSELHALRAARANCTHRPTYQTLTQAQALQGKWDLARASAARLMALSPGLTAAGYLEKFPGGATPYAHRLADALREAGVPA